LVLTIDIGNTRTKLGVFDEDELVCSCIYTSSSFEALLSTYSIQKSFIAFSGQEDADIINVLTQKGIFINYIDRHHLPISIDHYKTPETLGQDRILACIGARSVEIYNDILIITTGTCITYNMLTSRNDFLGGAISPGISMRLQAMHHYTDKLPEIEFTNQNPPYIGNTTYSSMESGAIIGLAGEIDNFVTLYKADFPEIKVFLTGGDAEFLKTKINNKIFADEHLVLKGLNALSRYYE
jgi:type III pantothenate kinase